MAGKMTKFTLAIIVPVLFLITLIFLMMSLFGLNPTDGFKGLIGDIPFVSSHQTKSAHSTGKGQDLKALKAQIKNIQHQNQALNAEISSKTDKVNRLQSEINAMTKQQQDAKTATKNKQEKNQEMMIQQTYKNMDPVKAAAIFDKMSKTDAAHYMNMLDDQTKASIMENLPATKAAALTPMLKAAVSSTSNQAGS